MSVRLALTGGAYSARSLISDCQRACNIFPETVPKINQAPVPVTHYLTPGLVEQAQPQAGKTVRGAYRATNGALYVCIGDTVYFVGPDFATTAMGSISPGTAPVSMQDNGAIVVLVDGTANGYWWALGTVVINQILDDAFYGAQRIQFLDGWFVLNRPATNQFYLLPYYWDGVEAIDPLYIASKTGGPDNIISISVIRGELWLIGALTSEVWFNQGGADFPFARQPGVFVEHGMLRGWSVAETDVEVLWLGRDEVGQGVVFQSAEYQAVRISNHAIEHAIQSYAVINDAIGFIYQQDGHTFYVLTFPTADKTWVYDLATKQWHERTWTDDSGEEHRHRVNCCAFAYNKQVVGDWENGKLYTWELEAGDDAGQPIVRRRGFPHLVKDGKRIEYASFIADMQVGTPPGLFAGEGPDIMLRWSDTRGASWSDPVPLRFGTTGQFNISLLWRRLGVSRDRVFELFWSHPYKTALNGAWVEFEPMDE